MIYTKKNLVKNRVYANIVVWFLDSKGQGAMKYNLFFKNKNEKERYPKQKS